MNQLFDAIISNPRLSEQEFDKAMQEWVCANQKLELKEEQCANSWYVAQTSREFNATKILTESI
ncbi:hypothetical protein [Ochrovirga pacifica]|uniref:hypothetical protein n=1 Tax=Ochrovirga pacifica TaxID=1042376 RepID=UPI001111B290|nr:hypothetical protein [Ochrovirga pacifica]